MFLVPFRSLRLTRLLAAAAGALLVAGCGGDVHQRFEPQRILSIGDEYSYIDPATKARYTVDPLHADGSRDCAYDRFWLWNQFVADRYGRSFNECPVAGRTADGNTRMLAQEGATVATLASQLDAVGGARDRDLLLVFVGANDVWELYSNPAATSPTPEGVCAQATKSTAEQSACARGQALARQLETWTRAGARVVVLDVPNQGSTPEAGAAGADRAQLERLTTAFNEGLRFTLPDDSRYIALVLANNRVRLAQQNNDSPYPFNNRNDPICTTGSAKDCTTSTLQAGASADDANNSRYRYVYAAGRHLTPTMHRLIGQLAGDRARDQPF
ncbi:MAG TPA: hypothetical protein VNO84_11990 [Burkholderiaceae bacterium]|nr:hypothetical protein [Burkholderiaceae bacterium]